MLHVFFCMNRRLEKITQYINYGLGTVDVGTDHGYLPVYLAKNGYTGNIIATDIRPKPLDAARRSARAAGQSERISFLLCDGLELCPPDKVDTIVIAGMGGELMLHILLDGEKVCASAAEMVLQPQSDIRKVRAFLREHQYKIIDEDMVYEDGKYYPMMKAVKDESGEIWMRMDDETKAVCDIYGPLLLRGGHPVLRRFLVRQHRQLTGLLHRLESGNKSEAVKKRILEIRSELHYNESAYTILGAIKNAGI